ncbi:NmrA family protein [Hyaloraphidium curvatum]|nr:NmrA family protein [Hyaloraphidium curvatum]
MRLAIFGGTGKTGRLVVERALAAGHEVRMLARSPDKVALKDPRLTVVAGQLSDWERVAETVRGTDVVISALGPTHNKPTFDVSAGMANIVAAMKQEGVKRIVATAGAGVPDPGDKPGWMDAVVVFMLKRLQGNLLADVTKAVEILRGSGLDYTVLRAPMLTDDAPTGSVRLGAVGKDIGVKLTRGDFAAELFKQAVEKSSWIGKAPGISN